MASRQNQWFVPGTGIAREVITADIQRYLGNDALVRPGVGTGEHQGQSGYWITAYRTLTTNMIEDLKNDSLRWQQERPGSSVQYQDSQTHRSRQHYGPTGGYGPATTYEQYGGAAYEGDPRRGAQTTASRTSHASAQGYGGNNDPYYVPTPSQPYQAMVGYGQTAQNSAAPRTQAVDPHAAYTAYRQQQTQTQQPGAAQAGTRTDYNPSPYVTYQTGGTDAYGRSTAAPGPGGYVPPSDPNSEWYIASDGRRYPRSMQPSVRK